MTRDAHSASGGAGNPTRREFLETGGRLAAASALAGVAIPSVHAADDTTIRLALIGCGGRGSGAVGDALEAPNGGPVKLWAAADLYAHRMEKSLAGLAEEYKERIDVPADRRFIGFDAYRKAIDCLRPGDVAMITGYAGFRPAHLEYAVEKGVNVFMEKSFAADVPGLRRVLKAGEAAEKKNLKIAAGLMCRHSVARQELIKRIRDGELGSVENVRGFRMDGAYALPRRPEDKNALDWQIQHHYQFFWVSGGLFIEMSIHQIDEICWIKDAWPVSAHGLGGRVFRSADHSQNLDLYGVEWTFPDGTTATFDARYQADCRNDFATYIQGTKKAAQFSGNIHAATVHTYKDRRMAKGNIDWRADEEPCTPWQAEWRVLLNAIRTDKPHNEARRAVHSNLAAILGRAAAHTGKLVTWDEAMASEFRFFPGMDGLTADAPSPIAEDKEGFYPVPVTGAWKEV